MIEITHPELIRWKERSTDINGKVDEFRLEFISDAQAIMNIISKWDSNNLAKGYLTGKLGRLLTTDALFPIEGCEDEWEEVVPNLKWQHKIVKNLVKDKNGDCLYTDRNYYEDFIDKDEELFGIESNISFCTTRKVEFPFKVPLPEYIDLDDPRHFVTFNEGEH